MPLLEVEQKPETSIDKPILAALLFSRRPPEGDENLSELSVHQFGELLGSCCSPRRPEPVYKFLLNGRRSGPPGGLMMFSCDLPQLTRGPFQRIGESQEDVRIVIGHSHGRVTRS
jgi:hypothetical protein